MATNTISCPIPDNITPLSPNGFNLAITKLPGLTYFAQHVAIPGISLPQIDQANPFVNAPIAGEILTFNIATLLMQHNQRYILK